MYVIYYIITYLNWTVIKQYGDISGCKLTQNMSQNYGLQAKQYCDFSVRSGEDSSSQTSTKIVNKTPLQIFDNRVKMVNNTGLETLCIIEDNPAATKRILTELMNLDFTSNEIEKRERILGAGFSNRANALKVMKEIYG